MTTTCIIHPNVRFGANHRIDDFVIIGAPPRETSPGEMTTLIGPNAIIRSHTIIYANHIGAITRRVQIVSEDHAGTDPGVVFQDRVLRNEHV